MTVLWIYAALHRITVSHHQHCLSITFFSVCYLQVLAFISKRHALGLLYSSHFGCTGEYQWASYSQHFAYHMHLQCVYVRKCGFCTRSCVRSYSTHCSYQQYLNILQTVLSAAFFTTASCFCICTLCTCNIYIRFIHIGLCFFYVLTSYPVIFSPLCKRLYCCLYLHTCTCVIVMCPLLSLPGHCSGVGDGHGVCFPQQDGGCCRRW